jgi:hypothetical protein
MAQLAGWATREIVTLDQRVSAARHDPINGISTLAAALHADPDLALAARDRLATYAGMSDDRLSSDWIARTTKTTLMTALAMANTMPDVPAGALNV